MLSCEGIGKNIEQAIENALFDLKAPREDVDIKILSEGGLFKKAKVLVTISKDAEPKYIKRIEKKVEEENKNIFVEVNIERKEDWEDGKGISKLIKQMKDEIIEQAKKDAVEKALEEKELKLSAKTAKKEAKAEVKAAKLKKVEEEVVNEVKNEEDTDEVGMDPMEFLKGLFEVAGKNVEINVTEDDKYITYSVEGEDLGDMIGHRGDSYYAINRILTAVTGKQEKRVLLDIGGYRKKREEVLTALAKRTAEKVAKTGRYSRLDPMNPSERRVIHSALAEDDRVVTLSKGEEPHRYVMIFPKGEND